MQQTLASVTGETELQVGAEFFGERRELLAQDGLRYGGIFQLKREWHDLSTHHSDQR